MASSIVSAPVSVAVGQSQVDVVDNVTNSTSLPKQTPKQPDQEAFKASMDALDELISTQSTKLHKIREQIKNLTKDEHSIADKKVKAELAAVKAELVSLVGDQDAIKDKIKTLNEKIKKQNETVNSVPGQQKFSSTSELDDAIADLQAKIDGGKLRLVEEAQTNDQISRLRWRRAGLVLLEELTAERDQLKAGLSDGKDSAEVKELKAREKSLAGLVVAANSAADDRHKRLQVVKQDRSKLQDELSSKREEKRRIQSDYYSALRLFQSHIQDQQKSRIERNRAERAVTDAKRRIEEAEAELSDLSLPAFRSEINAAKALIRALDPSAAEPEEPTVNIGPDSKGSLAAPALRTVSDSIKGKKLTKKTDQDEWYFGAAKTKKGKKAPSGLPGPSPVAESKSSQTTAGAGLQLDHSIITSFGRLNIAPPSSRSEVAAAIDRLKEKITWWTDHEADQTKAAVETAQAQLLELKDRLETAEGRLADLTSKSDLTKSSKGRLAIDDEAEKEN